MADVLAYRRNSGGVGARGERDLGDPQTEPQTAISTVGGHPLDGEEARKTLRQLMSWYYFERDRQARNRLEMATDHDFYDGDQWDPADVETLKDRNQMPLVYNEVAPMCDWLIGTERRNKMDWKILPRSADDVQAADTKTQVLKYVADVNNSAFARSRAFADAIKGGIGWVDDGGRDDPTKDVIYSQYEDWRCVLMDSTGLDFTGEDARYLFRWRWVDEDVAVMMFPDRADRIRQATEDTAGAFHSDPMDDEFAWESPLNDAGSHRSGTLSPLGTAAVAADAQRRRVKLIECQYRMPVRTQFIVSGPLRGVIFDQRDGALRHALGQVGGTIVDKVTLRMHVAVMTEAHMLAMGVAPYRHNRFSLTPTICYRHSRTRQPYGVIRRVRGIQQDLNKRASKALWLVNTNQLVGDRDAFDDWEAAREEAQDPQGVLPVKPGAKVEIRRDTDAATGQIQLMTMAAQSIQRGVNVTDENMGRKTNAVSGTAIQSRQLQGAVSTTEPFDNQRMAAQAQGEKQLSLIEQLYTEEKVLRLTGGSGPITWVRINQPEIQPDGSVRWLNDVAASLADFKVSDADYAGTLRQVMFDSLTQLGQRLPPEIALRLLRMAFQFSDLPNKDEITDEIRRLTGEQDPQKKLTPEEQQAAEQAAQVQAEAAQIQRESAMAMLEEQRAKAREINARAEKLMAEIETLRMGATDGGQMQAQIEAAVAKVREQAANQLDAMSSQLAKLTASNEAAILKVKSDADTATEVARIQAAATVRVAEIERENDAAMAAFEKRLDDLARMSGEVEGAVKRLEAEDAAEPPEPAPAPPPPAPAPPSPAPAAPLTINVQVDAGSGAAVQKEIVIKRDDAGNVIGATSVEAPKGEVKKSIVIERDANGAVTGAKSTPET